MINDKSKLNDQLTWNIATAYCNENSKGLTMYWGFQGVGNIMSYC